MVGADMALKVEDLEECGQGKKKGGSYDSPALIEEKLCNWRLRAGG
jgi:hypothetical protein